MMMNKCSECKHWHQVSEKYGKCDIATKGIFLYHRDDKDGHMTEHTNLRYRNRAACKTKFERNEKM